LRPAFLILTMKSFYILLIFCLPVLANAQIINFPDANFKSILLTGNSVDHNGDGEISIAEAETMEFLYLFNGGITDATGLMHFVNVKDINLGFNELVSVDLSNLTKLEELDVDSNLLTELDLEGLSCLRDLSCSFNALTELQLEGVPNLEFLTCGVNMLESVDLSHVPKLLLIDFSGNNLTTLDFSFTPEISFLYLGLNPLENLDFSPLTKLELFTSTSNQMTSADFSSNPLLFMLDLRFNDVLESVNIKNGSVISEVNLENSPALQFLCVNEQEVAFYQNYIESLDIPCSVNSYCSFEPGGTYYTLDGSIYYGQDVGGCDSQESYGIPNLSLTINEGSNIGYLSSSFSGEYSLTVPEGNYTVIPQIDHPELFEITPASVQVDFPIDGASVEHDFCVTPKNILTQLEISILPLGGARPGFPSSYKILIQNNGSMEVDGTVDLYFQGNRMEFLSAEPTVATQTDAKLVWEYEGLKPFERKEFHVDFELNSPMDSPPLNAGDVLEFTAQLFPIDSDRFDNTIHFKQTVVNAQDPNDKTCIEGRYVSQEYIGEYVHYIIRFENIGTADAVNVVVKDILDVSKFDVASLRVLDSSHDHIYKVRDENIVEFIFEGIYLPFEDDINDGYISFKIKTLPALAIGDQFENEAEIYFDYNFPIITDEALTSITLVNSSKELGDAIPLKLSPNPTNGTLHISTEEEMQSLSIYNQMGQLLYQKVLTQSAYKTELDVRSLRSGDYIIKIMTEAGEHVRKFVKISN